MMATDGQTGSRYCRIKKKKMLEIYATNALRAHVAEVSPIINRSKNGAPSRSTSGQ